MWRDGEGVGSCEVVAWRDGEGVGSREVEAWLDDVVFGRTNDLVEVFNGGEDGVSDGSAKSMIGVSKSPSYSAKTS